MKDLLLVLGLIVAALVVGTGLFFFGPGKFHALVTGTATPGVQFRLLKEGQNATTMTERANYRIQNGAQLNQLWTYLDPSPDAVPNIDFTKEEVFAVFDGTHTSGGYNIKVTSITEDAGVRTVHVTRTVPGIHCVNSEAITSPYQVIAVSKSDLTLAHVDTRVTQDCPSQD